MTARLTAAILLGIIIGAIEFPFRTIAWHMLFAPELQDDGYYLILVASTIPAGALMGGFTGAAITLREDPRLSGALDIAGALAGWLALERLVGSYAPEDIITRWGHGVICISAMLLWGIYLIVWRNRGADRTRLR